MITTVTTTTTTTLAASSLALIAILILITLLIKKELISGVDGLRAQRLNRGLNIAIVPLVFVFITTMALRVVDVLR
jgi:hypothetical protein